MRQEARKPKANVSSGKDIGNLVWVALVLIVLCSLATGLLVNFFNNLHYNNLLLKVNGQASAAQAELSKEQYDAKFIISNGGTQLNCYDLRSSYVRGICYKHEGLPGA